MSQKKILFIPPAGLTRWGARKKARIVIAVRSGILSRFEAYNRYMLSEEELSQWEEAFNRDGIAGLQTKIRSRRRLERGAEPTLHRASRRDVTPDFIQAERGATHSKARLDDAWPTPAPSAVRPAGAPRPGLLPSIVIAPPGLQHGTRLRQRFEPG
jgi:hypothetical protein